ncbi:acyltransferase family protein [uncultured Enterococcus sp.]|uniref:acyltransferase family protein n=1 Tax=uncultured Enterococcus sp. TaxID=167972 RepID=UPI00260D8838|nr:acyltransferase family protein [uncultured Enterococcus sp.]
MNLKHRYITGFDGIRTIAVIGVIFYHLFPNIVKGGYLGVPVFFVISGYLIVDLLRQEWDVTHKIDLKSFYFRRMKRLYPALIGVLVLSASYITLFQRNLLNNLRGVVVSSLLYFNNYWQIENQLSYFDRFHNPNPFTHLWSLSVEGQNYLILPLIFLLFYQVIRKKRNLATFFLLGSILSAIWMAICFKPGIDPTAVYDSTFTRLSSIWLGASLAIVWPSNRLKTQISVQAKKTLDIAGVIALLGIMISFLTLSAQSSFLYYGGMYLVSILSAVLVAATAHPGADFNRFLTNPVFDYIGKRSYGIYLYQFPVMIFYESVVKNINHYLWLHTIAEVALILAVSELSYRLIEVPCRRYDYSQLKTQVTEWFRLPAVSKEKIMSIPVIFVCCVALFGIFTAPANQKDDSQKAFEATIAKNKKAADATKTTQSTTEVIHTTNEIANKYQLTDKQLLKAQQMNLTMVGDSVMLGAVEEIKEIFPNVVVDADIGRQLYNGEQIIQALLDKKLLANTVVIGLGTNGVYTEENFHRMMTVIGKKRKVYLLNAYVPTQRWQGDINRFLSKMADEYKNITLIDWYDLGREHEDWFEEDHVHLKQEGQIGYTALIAQTILK